MGVIIQQGMSDSVTGGTGFKRGLDVPARTL